MTESGRPAPLVEVSVGELLDKISILEIKAARITDPQQSANVRRELEHLLEVRRRTVPDSPEVERAIRELSRVNSELWEIEDRIRACESRADFGSEFIDLARAVYRTNDLRAALKRTVNLATGSKHIEEKSHLRIPGQDA